MSNRQAVARKCGRAWGILFGAAALIGVALWVLSTAYPSEIPGRGMLNDPALVVRQAVFGLMALILAGGIGFLFPTQGIRRFCIVLAAILATVLFFFSSNPFPAFFRSWTRECRLLNGPSTGDFQTLQSMLSIHAGGLTGCRAAPPNIPCWHTDFIFGRLCGAGGLLSGWLLLFLTGLFFTLIWRVVARAADLKSRAAAAVCAAVLTAPALLHLAVNTGLLPALPFNFPFLSYGPKLLLLNGAVLGLLLALDRCAADSHTPASRWTGKAMFIGVWLILLLFAVRLAVLRHSPHLEELRTRQLHRIEERVQNTSVRGRILDVNGRVLAQSVQSFTVCADPRRLVEMDGLGCLPQLARLIGMEETELTARITGSSRRYMRLSKDAPVETVDSVRRMNEPGVFIEAAPAREYPEPVPLAHLVGFVIGADELRGGGGVELIQNQEVESGRDTRLTIDIDLQTALQRIAEDSATDTKAKQVQIIVMNPETGAIRAAAQVPAAHGGNSAKADPFSLNWRAVIDLFEPGGLMMPLVVASALEAGVLTKDARIDCENGAWEYCGFSLRDAAPFGELSADEILSRSSNIGMAKVGLLLGKQPLYDSLVAWGLPGKCSAGGFGGVPAGLLYPPARWSELEITRIPIGHACAFSLLQVMRAYTAFFNDGRIVEPYLIESEKPVQLRPVLKPQAAFAVRGMLVKVVDEGTGQSARIDGVPVFGKTAIVQKLTPDNRGYSPDKVQTAFIGGVQKEGIPVLIAVWLDEPEREAGFNPAPEIFAKVAAMHCLSHNACTTAETRSEWANALQR